MKKNKILVATNHLEQVGGSELYTYDLIKALHFRRDCDVEYFTFEKGEVSQKIENELGVPFMGEDNYDLILANHVPVVEHLYAMGPIIQICHGIAPTLEQPSAYADFHVAISEEVNLHLKSKNVSDSTVILNGLDLEEKRIERPVNKRLNRVLSLCQSESANEIIEELCDEEGWSFLAFNKHVNPIMDIVEEINNHDLIVGIGRSIYDAMACGRPCVVFDDRNYNGNMGDGYLTPDNFEEYVTNNCSGRFSRKKMDKKSLLAEFKKYDFKDGGLLREIAEEELDMDDVGEKLITLLEEKRLDRPFNRIKKRILKLGGKKMLGLFSKIYI